MGSFLIDNTTSDFLFIRPSGNPIDAKGFAEMWSSGDLVLETTEITKVHKFDFLCDDVAMCVFTLGSKFTGGSRGLNCGRGFKMKLVSGPCTRTPFNTGGLEKPNERQAAIMFNVEAP